MLREKFFDGLFVSEEFEQEWFDGVGPEADGVLELYYISKGGLWFDECAR